MPMFKKQMGAFGLDFSDTVVKAAQLNRASNSIDIVGIGREVMPPGIIEDGEVLDIESLAEHIKKVCQNCKPKKIDSKFVVYSIPETKGFIRVIKIPKMDGDELVNEIFAEAEQVFPISLEDAYFDWQVIGDADKAGKYINVLVSAVNQKVVDTYSEAIKLAGLKPIVAEIESIAITRSLIGEKKTNKPVLVIDLGKDRTGFIIFESPAVRFTASIPICGKELDRVVAEKFDISEEEAKKIRNECGISIDGQCAKVYEAMDYSLKEMTNYINKLLGYYRDHSKSGGDISKVIICGGEAQMEGISSLLSLRIKKEVENGNPWVNIMLSKNKEIPPISRNESMVFVTVLGLALRGIYENDNMGI